MGARGARSPEGQAFVVEMQAAWRDWVASGSPGAIPAAQTGPGANVAAQTPGKNAAARTWVRGATATAMVAGALLALVLAAG